MHRILSSLALGVISLVAVVVIQRAVTPRLEASPQKPTKHSTYHFDGGVGAPATLSELWAMSAIVVDATINADRPADLELKVPGGHDPKTVIVRTAYELRVNEYFKDTLNMRGSGRHLEIVQVGGDRDRGDHVESVDDDTFQRLKKGERYLLFLAPTTGAAGAMKSATDTADSAYLLSEEGAVIARGRSALAVELGRYSRDELLNVMRDFKEGRR